MKKHKVFLILNGDPPNKIPDLSNYKIICATDGAYKFLEKNNITPDFISGDFDSLKKLPKTIQSIHTPDQNFTDFHKILQILSDKGFADIHVFGASGKEQDHFLGNLHTALQWKERLNITFFDNYGYYFLADKSVILDGVKGKTVSLIPFHKATGISTKGLQYVLNNEELSFGDRIGTRNIAIKDKIDISLKKGNLFIFIND